MHNEFRHQTKVNMTYIVMAFDNTILSFSSSYHTNRRWKKAKVNVQNQGKMPLIVFGNGFFNDMAIKRHMAAPIKKIYANLKRRERLGQAVIVQIDEYLTSQVHSYFLFFCCCEHVIDAFLLFCRDLQQLPKTGIGKMGRSRRKRVPWHFRMQKLSYALEPRCQRCKKHVLDS
jgi:hypothetical protein